MIPALKVLAGVAAPVVVAIRLAVLTALGVPVLWSLGLAVVGVTLVGTVVYARMQRRERELAASMRRHPAGSGRRGLPVQREGGAA